MAGFLNNRHYLPSYGTFASVDPILRVGVPASLNPYVYSDGNPIALSDPSGLTPSHPSPDGGGIGMGDWNGCGAAPGGGGDVRHSDGWCYGDDRDNPDGEVVHVYDTPTRPGFMSQNQVHDYVYARGWEQAYEREIPEGHGCNWFCQALAFGMEMTTPGDIADGIDCGFNFPSLSCLGVFPFLSGGWLRRLLGRSGNNVAQEGVEELAEAGAEVVFRSDTSHIFRDAAGHLANDTAANRSLIQSAIDPANLRSTITLPDGSTLDRYFLTLPDGTQVWAEVRNGTEITNGGLNVIPR